MTLAPYLPSGPVKPGAKNILLSALATLVAAVVINTIIYFIFDALDAFPSDVILEQADGPLTLGNVFFATLSGVFGGTIFWAILTRFTKSPIKVFRIVSTFFFVVSLFSPFSIKGAPDSMVIGLLLMHLVTFAACVLILARRSQQVLPTSSDFQE